MKLAPSPYQLAIPEKKSRKFAAKTLDTLVLMLLCVFFFVLGDLIGSNTPYYQKNSTRVTETREELYSLVEESHLSYRVNGTLVSLSTQAEGFVKRQTKSSLLRNGTKREDLSIAYIQTEDASKENDGVYQYLCVYKVENLVHFQKNQDFHGKTAFISAFGEQKDLFEEDEEYFYLKKDVGAAIDNYLRDSKYEAGKQHFEAIKEQYRLLLLRCTDDFQTNNLVYLETSDSFNAYKRNVYQVKAIEVSVAYALAVVFCFFVLPLTLKEKVPLTEKIMHFAAVRRDGNVPKVYNLLAKTAVNFVEYPLVMGAVALIVYGSGGADFLLEPLFFGASLLSISLFSILMMIVGFSSIFLFKKRNETLSEAISYLYVVNKDEMEAKKNAIEE